ncbi:MAG TPA: sensor histidine kinase [Lichenihabitans sp.]|jgi:two-component sensor histidine kinase|nr:sensor histidine kinase [Lichenihabitans sp.]
MPRRDHGVGTFIQLLVSHRFPFWIRYGGALGLVILFVALRLSIPVGGVKFVLFIPAVFAASLAFGPIPGLVAMLLTTLAALAMLLWRDGQLPVTPSDLFSAAVYVIVGSGIAMVCHVLRATTGRALAAERSKSVLLEEMTHRTKNDLQTVASLLSLQARSMPADAGRAAIEAAAARVMAIAKLHNRLRTDRGHGVVDLRDYLDDLCQDLMRPYGELRPVAVRLAADSVVLKTAVAAPIGLIVNELVTNAFKYAFPDNRSGTIRVDFHRREGTSGFELEVADDGVGSTEARDGLGSRLVKQLVQQLGGTIERRDAAPGTVTVVTFDELA